MRERPLPCRQHAAHKGWYCGTRAQAQTSASGIDQGQRAAHEHLVGIGANATHQVQRGAVCADQDVLAIVEHAARGIQPPCPAARGGGQLEQAGLGALLQRPHRRRQAGPACAYHGDAQRLARSVQCLCRCAADAAHRPRQWVFSAIHSLRSGVSEVRWCST